MTSGPEVYDFYPVWLPRGVDEHDIFRFEVGVDQPERFQLEQSHENLLEGGAYVLEGEWTKFTLFEEVVEILFQEFKYQARMVFVLEVLVRTDKIEVVCVLRAESREDADLDLTLPRIGGVVLEDLDCDDLVRAALPALDDLPERPPPQKLQHLVTVRQRAQHFMLD